MKRTLTIGFLFLAMLTTLFLVACQSAEPASLSNDQVLLVADNILKAVNQGQYENFTQDFSAEMKTGFTRDMFTGLADLVMNASGNYVTCANEAPELTNNQGFAVYRLICDYEKEKVVVTLTFKMDGDQVEGLFLDSTNLRKASQ